MFSTRSASSDGSEEHNENKTTTQFVQTTVQTKHSKKSSFTGQAWSIYTVQMKRQAERVEVLDHHFLVFQAQEKSGGGAVFGPLLPFEPRSNVSESLDFILFHIRPFSYVSALAAWVFGSL